MCLLLTGCSAGERLWNKAWDAHHWTPWWRRRSTQRVLLLRMERRLEYPTVGPLLSLFLSQTHTAAHLSMKLSQYTFTHSTHTLMLNRHRGVSHAEGMLCSEELTRAPDIKWTQAFYISSSNGNWQQKPWNTTCVTKISIYEIGHVAHSYSTSLFAYFQYTVSCYLLAVCSCNQCTDFTAADDLIK